MALVEGEISRHVITGQLHDGGEVIIRQTGQVTGIVFENSGGQIRNVDHSLYDLGYSLVDKPTVFMTEVDPEGNKPQVNTVEGLPLSGILYTADMEEFIPCKELIADGVTCIHVRKEVLTNNDGHWEWTPASLPEAPVVKPLL